MNDFLRYVLYQLKNALILAALGTAVGAAVLGVAYGIYRHRFGKEKPFPWKKTALYFLLAGYLVILGYATLMRQSWGIRELSLHPFRAWREAWNDFSFKSWANVLLNVALFLPAGFLAPLLWKRLQKWYLAIPAGLGLSLAIELAQLGLARGLWDVDDLIANTLGTALGFFLVMTLAGLRKRRQFLRYGGLFLGLLAVLALPFGLYGLKTYGNLPQAPAYRLDTSDTRWELGCPLPEDPENAPVYRAEKRSKAQCDEMAAAIAGIAGAEVAMKSYYQEMAYYNLQPGGILQVYYHDGSWEYLGAAHFDYGKTPPGDRETQWPARTREQVEAALEDYPVFLPEEAEFTPEEEGWYRFSCQRREVGDILLDGTLRCRLTPEGEVMQLRSGLLPYAYHSHRAVLSPGEAWQALREGRFRDTLGYVRAAPGWVRVTQCRLAYLVDTKGFYQPVWEFHLEGEGSFGGWVTVPAL